MSVYRHKGSPYYQYDFQLKGHRFYGSTGCTARKEAERFESDERENAKKLVKAMARSKTSLAIDDVAARLWHDKAQYDAEPTATDRNLARLIEYFGEAKLLTDIDHKAAKELVAWRRGHRVSRRGKLTKEQRAALPLISNATVNRSTTKVLQRLFTFATAEGAIFESEPKWDELLLPEPEERFRELKSEEATAIDAAMRDDYGPFFDFVRASGMRLRECVTLRWAEVDFGARQIVRLGKGGRRVVFPITPAVREILFPLRGQHAEFVFCYRAVCANKRLGRVRGQRYPLTYNGTKTAWQRLRAIASLTNFRFHDFRHDFGTKLLRDSGNLKLVQKAMNHRDIKSTLRYAHVLDEDVAPPSSGSRSPGKIPGARCVRSASMLRTQRISGSAAKLPNVVCRDLGAGGAGADRNAAPVRDPRQFDDGEGCAMGRARARHLGAGVADRGACDHALRGLSFPSHRTLWRARQSRGNARGVRAGDAGGAFRARGNALRL
jgi:integrase